MISEQIENLFYENGYNKTPSNLPEFTFYWRKENQGLTVLFLIDYRQGLYISEDQYVHMKERIADFFQARGEEDIHTLSLILSEDTEKAKKLCVSDSFCWMIDTSANRLLIHENQVEDFYGWKTVLEDFLAAPQRYESGGQEEAGEPGAYGRGHESEYGRADRGRESEYGRTQASEYGRADRGRESEYGRRRAPEYGRADRKKWDRKRLAQLPWVNICLVAANVIIFLICTFTGELLYNKGAFGVQQITEDGSYYRLFTSLFLHMDVQHLFSNMIVLYYVGEIVEKKIGHISYAVIYFLSGVMGDIFSMGYELLSGNYYSSVGASGAVFGVEGALLLLIILHHGKIEYMTAGRLAFAIAFSLYCGFTGGYVNNAAHIGGVLMGFTAAAVIAVLSPRVRIGKDKDNNES